MSSANEYLKEKSVTKAKWGAAKTFLGTLVLPLSPITGASLIANGVTDLRTAMQMSDAAKDKR